MKKKVLYAFSLLLYLLIVCTLLSDKIEDEMCIQAEVKYVGSSEVTTVVNVPLSALFSDLEGSHLYRVVNGTGWESGLLVEEIPRNTWSIDMIFNVINVTAYGNESYNFILSASSFPDEGRNVELVDSVEEVDDQYLCLFPTDVPEELVLPSNAEVVAQSRNILLLSMSDVGHPFFEHTAQNLSESLGQTSGIISLGEATQFLDALPYVAWVGIMIMAGIVLWGLTCLLGKRNRWIPRLNAAVSLVFLIALWWVLGQIDLPASMMPSEVIFDWSHYSEKLAMILSSMDLLGLTSHDFVLSYAAMIDNVKHVVLYGGIGVMLAVLLECSMSIIKDCCVACIRV